MNDRIINADRYKKITRKEVEKKRKNNKIKYSTKTKKENDLKYKKKKLNDIKKQKKKNEKNNLKYNTYENNGDNNLSNNKSYKKKKVYVPTVFKICIVVLVIVGIGFLSRKIVDFENMPILNVFSNKDQNKNLQKDYSIKLGISKLDTTDVLKSKNIILNELNIYASDRLISINKDYTINYLNVEKIEKINNKEYLIYLVKDTNITYDVIKSSVDRIKKEESNIYFKNVNKIKEITNENDYIRISLNEEDPLYMYKLNFPLYENKEKTEYNIAKTTDKDITFTRNKSQSTLKDITLTNYKDTDDMVADFREDKIDMFFASSDSIMQMIGKHEYNVKKYRDGQNVFLFGNKNSKLFKLKEIRKALAYSFKREDVIKEVNNSFSELIDLPFIYSDIKYKYDIYGAENELLSNGWKKVDGIYSKNIDGVSTKAELNILVNEEDGIKNKIAENLKKMAKNVGIKIHIVKVPSKDFEKKVSDKEYDIILADVYINEYPDIEFLKEYVDLNERVDKAFEDIYNSQNKEELEQNITSLQETMSSEIACIGILARNSNVVYQKYITGFDYTNYMMVFNNLKGIGRISDEKE